MYELSHLGLGGVQQFVYGQTSAVCELAGGIVDQELKRVHDGSTVADSTDAVLAARAATWTPELRGLVN